MSNSTVNLSTKPPTEPDGADFALYFEFVKGSGDPGRVFRAADQTIRAFKLLDHAFCASVDSNIETVMVLEEIEAGSLKVWLRNILTSTDDQALKGLDWRPAIGKYLVRAKYVYLRWANREGLDGSLTALGREIQQIAQETDVKHLPDYAPPPAGELIEATRTLDEARGMLISGDSMKYISEGNPDIDFNLSIQWNLAELEDLSVKETTTLDNIQMNLIVKKPDYLGVSKWDVRHGTKAISAKIEDGDWLTQFQSRQIDIRPGDALKCKVTIEHRYGYDNELISEKYVITEVLEVLENKAAEQRSIFDEEEE